MSVTTTGNRITYTGNGVTTVFAFPYLFLANTDIVVIVDGVTQTVGFTVTGAADPNGGNVTFLVAPAVGAPIILYRDPDLLQQTVLSPNDPFPAKTVERMSDKLTLIAQRINEVIQRSFRLSDADSSTASVTVPTPIANNLIGWNSSASGLQNVDPASFAGIVAFGNFSWQSFSGDGVTTDFVLSSDPIATGNIDCAVGGVVQRAVIDYTIVGPLTIRITPAPPVGVNNVFFRWGSALPLGVASSVAGQTTAGTQLIQAASLSDAFVLLAALGGRIGGSIEMAPGATISFEGSTEDAFETFLTITNPTADRTYTFPDRSGTVAIEDDEIATLTATVAANALTIGVPAGVEIFRNASLTSGVNNIRAFPALTLVAPSGSTFGSTNNVSYRLIVIEIDSAGTIELAVVNQAGGINLDETTLISTTAISAAATSATTVYSTTARTNLPFRVIGFIDLTETTAGVHATTPSKVQGIGGNNASSFGPNQSRSAPARAIATTYTNNTSRTRRVSITYFSTTAATGTLTINGSVLVQQDTTGASGKANISEDILPGETYSFNASPGTPTISTWTEIG